MPGCRNLVAGAAVKAEVVSAYRRVMPSLQHVAVGHPFYYGQCGSMLYAAARFVPGEGVTDGELVSFQDEGATMKFFARPASGSWRRVGGEGFPASPKGCAEPGSNIPAALASLWGDCPDH